MSRQIKFLIANKIMIFMLSPSDASAVPSERTAACFRLTSTIRKNTRVVTKAAIVGTPIKRPTPYSPRTPTESDNDPVEAASVLHDRVLPPHRRLNASAVPCYTPPVSLVVFNEVGLTLGGKAILNDASFRVAEKDRIGLIGPNGSGKTTLLRVLAAQQQIDAGDVSTRREMRLGYLPQDVSVEGGKALFPFVRESVPGRAELATKSEAAQEELNRAAEAGDEDAMMAAAQVVTDLHEEGVLFDTFYSDHEAKRILDGLGFSQEDLDRDLGEFSGGWKMRAVLGALLFQRPDLLLLDEPTNHLDMPSVAWLSTFLKRYDRAFVLISHDREFLNEQIDRVVSFEVEGLRSYKGDYEAYRKQRAEEQVLLEARSKNLEKEKEHLQAFITRFRAKASKAAQVQSRVKQLAKLDEVELHKERAVMRFRFPACERTGKVVIETEGIAKSYGELDVLKGVDLHVKRGDRIALIGVNGAGKTTLLKIMGGELSQSAGSVKLGHNVKLGYYAQHHADSLRKDRTVYDEVSSCAKEATHQQIRTILGAMLFGDREVDKLVGVLSGGERARVALSQLLIDPGNVLLMDEPTNHLDLESSERLAEALQTYDGSLLFVSHNRGFIRRLANKIWFVADGKVEEYPGSFDEYLDACARRGESKAGSTSAASDAPRRGAQKDDKKKSKGRKRAEADARRLRKKRLGPLERRVGELEKKIARLEGEQKKTEAELADPAVYEDTEAQARLSKVFSRTTAELEVAMESWTEAQDELEKASAAVDAELQ